MKTVGLTVLTLLAFAGNSILCRMALRTDSIDPVSFTALRLLSGAMVLLPFLPRSQSQPWNLKSSAALLLYALTFSLAYVSLDTGTGALLLFGTVQFTMIGAGYLRGERSTPVAIAGILLAAIGVVYLCLPGASAPSLGGAGMMIAAGVGWGLYSLSGKSATQPAAATACNFVSVAPFAILLLCIPNSSANISGSGLLIACVAGALTTGAGYVLWYATLPKLSATTASVVQLAVPVIAATGGVAFMNEQATTRLIGAGILTLGGVAMALLGNRKRAQ
jgi:drug/metabolite transporter (DMT)-like permease